MPCMGHLYLLGTGFTGQRVCVEAVEPPPNTLYFLLCISYSILFNTLYFLLLARLPR